MPLNLALSSGHKTEQAVEAYEVAVGKLVSKADEYVTSSNPTRGFSWRHLIRKSTVIPRQGWKLHVSLSAVGSAYSIEMIGDRLLNLGASFKLPESLQGLLLLNSGQAGISQIGKIFTVYPASDAELLEISNCLAGLEFSPGPMPLSDLAVVQGRGQSIRYGGFSSSVVHWTRLGRPYAVISGDDGSPVEDTRPIEEESLRALPGSTPLATEFRPDPLNAGGDFELDGNTFLPVGIISKNSRFRLDLAVSLADLGTCILKRARRGVAEDAQGNCAHKRLKNEFRILSVLQGHTFCPAVRGFDPSLCVLAMEDIEGVTVEKVERRRQLELFPLLADALGKMHSAGVVHRDVKLSNCILTNGVNPEVKLIDFELAARTGQADTIAGGTPGYIPSEGLGAIAAPSYDVFSLGVCLAQWALGFDPSRLPLSSTRGRILRLLLLHGRRETAKIFGRLTHPDPSLRPSAESAAQFIRSNTEAIFTEDSSPYPAFAGTRSICSWARGSGDRVLPALENFTKETKEGLAWRNNHLFADYFCRSLNIGAAGILLGLIHLRGETSSPRQLTRYIRDTSSYLSSLPASDASGLFTGDCGMAVALAAAGKLLGDERHIARSTELFREALASESDEWDLFSGTAGMIYAGCCISKITGSPQLVSSATNLVTSLIDRAEERRGVICWPSTIDFDPDARAYFGAAHGACGAALALAVWARSVGGDKKVAGFAGDVFHSVLSHSKAIYENNIAETLEGGQRPPQYWCHGIAGYAWCLLQAFPDEEEMVEPILWAVSSLRQATPLVDYQTVCHGLPGLLEVWSMIAGWADQRHDHELAQEARSTACRIARVLRLTAQQIDEAVVWGSEDPTEITPDLWVGFMGPAVALSRFGRGCTNSMIGVEAIASAVER